MCNFKFEMAALEFWCIIPPQAFFCVFYSLYKWKYADRKKWIRIEKENRIKKNSNILGSFYKRTEDKEEKTV